MSARKAAESTLYHLSPKGFWKKFRMNLLLYLFEPFAADITFNQAMSSPSTLKYPAVFPLPASTGILNLVRGQKNIPRRPLKARVITSNGYY
jgi:hypothetical protein